MSDSKIQLRCTSAFTFGGGIVRPGEVVELTRAEAANLLHRGRVELVDAADAVASAPAAPDQPRKKPGRKPKAKDAPPAGGPAANDGEAEDEDPDAGDEGDGEADDGAPDDGNA